MFKDIDARPYGMPQAKPWITRFTTFMSSINRLLSGAALFRGKGIF